jgi:hypothetical protein
VDGDLKCDDGKTKSTLNMIASHISALIRLQERIFTVPKLKRDYDRALKLIEYYLFTVNIDTLYGYRKLLVEMFDEKALLPGVYWFLLNVMVKNFYNCQEIKRFYKMLEKNDHSLDLKIKSNTEAINRISEYLKKQLTKNGLNLQILNWIKNEL